MSSFRVQAPSPWGAFHPSISPQIEHRLFSFISIHWRGQPLVDDETVVSLIGATATTTGLTVRARLDLDDDPTGVSVPDAAMAGLALHPHALHPQGNYTLAPRPTAHRHVIVE